MFKLLNKIFQAAEKKLNNNSAQIAVLVIVVIAISLVFYAVSLNLGQLSTTKTAVTMASNLGASFLGSEMASYGQYLFETQLDGHEHMCAGTNVLVMVLLFIIIVIIAVIAAPFTSGYSLTGILFAGTTMFGLAMLALSIILQMTIVQPGISAMWNSMMQEELTQSDQFIEKGINTGLVNIVSDQKNVPDFYDYDQDSLWGLSGGKAVDEIARFSVYYTNRLQNIPAVTSEAVRQFLKDLKEFVYQGTDNWGLYDPVGSNFGCEYDVDSTIPVPSVCNECCVPKTVEDPLDKTQTVVVRNEFCDCIANGTCTVPSDEVGQALGGTCSQNSMYPDRDIASREGYRFMYNKFFENPNNKFSSFIEQIGVDDEVKDFYKDKSDINHQQFFVGDPASPGENSSGSYTNTTKFRIQDATGYYVRHSRNDADPLRDRYAIDYQAFTDCLTKCSNKNCAVETDHNGPLPRQPSTYIYTPLNGTPITLGYDYSGVTLGTFDENIDCTGTALNNTNGWLTVIQRNRQRVVLADGRPGIFPLLYKLRDWGLDLTSFNPTANPDDCHWVDTYQPWALPSIPPNCPDTASGGQILPEQLRIEPLDLPNDPTTLVVNKTNIVDGKNVDVSIPGIGLSRAYLGVDRVHIRFKKAVPPATSEYEQLPILANDQACAQAAFDREMRVDNPAVAINTQYGFWKAGDDKFCAPEDSSVWNVDDTGGNTWPYQNQCDKIPEDGAVDGTCPVTDPDPTADPVSAADLSYVEATCECKNVTPNVDVEAPNKSKYYNDVLDDMVSGMQFFVNFAEPLLKRDEDSNVRDFKMWYTEAAPWIEPGTNPPWSGHSAVKDETAAYPCYECQEENGALWVWYREIQELVTRFQMLLDGPYYSNAPFEAGDDACNQVWCGPDIANTTCFAQMSQAQGSQKSKYIWPDEKAQMGPTLENVMQCLDYNINGDVSQPGSTPVRFQNCLDACENLRDWVSQTHLAPAANMALLNTLKNNYTTLQLGEHGLDQCTDRTNYFLPRSLVYHPTAVVTPPIMIGDRFNPNDEMEIVDKNELDNFYDCKYHCLVSKNAAAAQVIVDLSACSSDYTTDLTTCAATYDPIAQPLQLQACKDQALFDFNTCNAKANSDYNVAMAARSCTGNAGVLKCDDPTFETTLQSYLEDALNSCNDEPDLLSPGSYINGSFLDLIQKSIPEAENQLAKFKKRYEFLSFMRDDIKSAVDIFTNAEQMFYGLLTCDDFKDNVTGAPGADGKADGAVCELIRERIKDKETGLPYQVVYGWQGETPKNRPAPKEAKPYWHIVKIEARIPQKCDGRCNTTQDGVKGWPYVKTYTKNWGLTRCFKIANKSGAVKFRVTRWDQDRDTKRILTFPNGMPIWDFKFKNPQRDVQGNLDPDMLQYSKFDPPHHDDFVCKPLMGPSGSTDAYLGAFMMDKLKTAPPAEDNTDCWTMAHYLLADGITTETCAQYYFAGTGHGYTFKFVPCKNF